MTKRYSEVILLPTYEDRLEYLRLNGRVGEDTFGFDRIFNQRFYTSKEWRKVRDAVIYRDSACDLACSDREIFAGQILIHHINPITLRDIEDGSEALLDPDNLITVSFDTHQIIHYGNRSISLPAIVVERSPRDICPWKQIS